jgi:hypothetical protein
MEVSSPQMETIAVLTVLSLGRKQSSMPTLSANGVGPPTSEVLTALNVNRSGIKFANIPEVLASGQKNKRTDLGKC